MKDPKKDISNFLNEFIVRLDLFEKTFEHFSHENNGKESDIRDILYSSSAHLKVLSKDIAELDHKIDEMEIKYIKESSNG